MTQTAAESLKDLDEKILVYCRSGKRSAAACEQLEKMGYQNVYNFGGILDWPYEINR
ncbi:MAG: rhodanese-like domain-containing protein [Beduini sp.]|uniref:rhodanese-like domain-containing protein n=1 Tax=Beduini sp. TaxID=1922300 RepID=UPI0039A0A882